MTLVPFREKESPPVEKEVFLDDEIGATPGTDKSLASFDGPLTSIEGVTEILPGMYRAETFALAKDLILRSDVYAVIVPVEPVVRKANHDFATFAIERGLNHNSKELYDHSFSPSAYSKISSTISSQIDPRVSPTADPNETSIRGWFKHIGFMDAYPESSERLVQAIVRDRKALAELFPEKTSLVDTQFNVGSTAPRPHCHSDIAIGRTIVGGTTMLVPPEDAKALHFQHTNKGTFQQLDATETPDELQSGIMSVAPDTILFFKGLLDPTKPMGHPENLGATHCSPANTDTPRLFLGSFVVPEGWSHVKVHTS